MSKLASVPNDTHESVDVGQCVRVNPSPPCLVTSSSPLSGDFTCPPRSPRTLPRTKKHKKDDFDGCFHRRQEMPPEASSYKSRNRVASPLSHGSSRQSNKPQMEKKRRQREKESLTKIRECISSVFKVDPSKYLDKAEILDKTVKLLDYIMARHYSSNFGTNNEEQKTSSSLADILNNTKIPIKNFMKGNNNNININTDTSHNISNFNCQGNRKILANRVQNNQEPVVALYIPQGGINFQNVSNCVPPLDKSNIVTNSVKSNATSTPLMQVVVNNNYYMKSGQGNSFGEPSSPESNSSCEVSSSDSSSSDNSREESFPTNVMLQNKIPEEIPEDVIFQKKTSPENSSPLNLQRNNTRDKIITVQHNKPQISFGQRLIAPKPLVIKANLHRPWEK